MQVITRYMHYVGAQCYYIHMNVYEGQLPTHYPPRLPVYTGGIYTTPPLWAGPVWKL